MRDAVTVPHEHGHHAGGRAAARHLPRLRAAFVLTLVLAAAQGVAAFVLGSLALLSDTGHVLTDALGIGMALAAIHVAGRGERAGHRTFGLYRLEILAALANAALLLGVAGYVVAEAVRRLGDPPELSGGPLAGVALAGLAVNAVAFVMLRPGARESLNVRGAQLEVLADLAGSLGVLAAAGVVWSTGWDDADSVAGAAIGVFILPRALRLGRDALRILLQAAPRHLDVGAVRADLAAIDEVVDVHDLHVWTLTSEMDVLSAHLVVERDTDLHTVLDRARELLRDRHAIAHATLQVEPDDHTGCAEVDW